MINPFYYKGVNPTVDLIIINPNHEILLIKRSSQSIACPSMYAFPGGFIDSNQKQNDFFKFDLESPEEAARRELKEETNLELTNHEKMILVGEYEGNNRDPRDNDISWSKTYAFFHRLNDQIFQSQKNQIRGLDDVDEAKWFDLKEAVKLKLAFDHNIILNDTLKLINE